MLDVPRREKKAAPAQPDKEALDKLVEEYGLWFNQLSGMPRMGGRVLGWLLVCEEPGQTLQELAENLRCSMGSVSTMTRMLEDKGLVERVSHPGERRLRYRIRLDAWSKTWEDQIQRVRKLQDLAERSVAVLGGASDERRERIETLRHHADFYAEQLPRILESWQRHNAGADRAGARR